MFRRVSSLVVVGLVAGFALAGCSAHDSTGRVSVTVSSDAADHPYEVRVSVDDTHQMVEHQRVFPGGSADFAGVPLGRVTVRAADLCPAHATVSDGDVPSVTLTPRPCSG